MRGTNKDRSTQPVRNEMWHVSIAALALGTVVVAGLVLVYVSRHVHQHPGAVLLVVLGFPVLILLAIILGKRRRAHA
jgi:ABC-type transport system involved in cytochrome c biogenesis permease component